MDIKDDVCFSLSFWTDFVFVFASGVCKIVWMCSMSEVPHERGGYLGYIIVIIN